MSSVMRGFSQPVTKYFTTLDDTVNMSSNALIESALNEGPTGSWTKVGSLYMVDTLDNFKSFLTNLASNNDADGVALEQGETLLDMGHELRFGVVGDESSLLVYRQVKRSFDTSNVPGGGVVGYVVTSNTLAEAGACNSGLRCRVSRS